MISSDDHPPPDLQNSNDFKIHSDDKADASVPDFDLDLFKSLVADLNDTNKPLPSFSIRDYVFSSRSKDIACNWPFSQKSLQICLQHGVKNLLPPFQSPESLRDHSSVENRRSDEEIIISSDGKPIVDDFVLLTSYDAKSNPELKFKSTYTDSSRSKGDKEPLTHLQEDVAHTKLKKTSLVSSKKTEDDTIQTTIKKCRFGVKLNTGFEPVEEATPNNFIVSETMASKVCPVCKTFSSSSNTTLNAHIDQCLSGESSMKWTANPKVIIKHRIKPRKTRLMVDIYETAPHCTVEELDARNGTSWANNSSFPAQELEFHGEEEKEERRATTVLPEAADHEGAVYIDTNGTKVRILSVPKVGTSDDLGAQKLQKRGKLSKLFLVKKNKNHEHKNQNKYLKLSPNSKKFTSPKPNRGAASCEIRKKEFGPIMMIGDNQVSSCREESAGKEPMNPEVCKKMDDLPIVRPPWACSKRTGLAKKVHGNYNSANNATKNLSVAGDKFLSNCVTRSPPSLSAKVATSSQHNGRKTGSLSPYKEHPSSKNLKEFSPLSHYAKKRSSLLTKPSSKHLKKEGMPLGVCPSKGFKGSDVRSKGSKFSSLGKKLSSVSKEQISKSSLKRKFFALKKSCAQPLSKQKVAIMGPSQDSSKQQSRVEEDTSGRTSSDSMNMSLLEVRKKDEAKICRQENHVALRSSNDIADPSGDVESVRKETQVQKDQSSSMQEDRVIDVAGSSMALSNSLNPDNMFDLQEQADDTEMYCADFNEKDVHMVDVTDDIKRQQDLLEEVDPLSLPEPPGSFLPSPGRETVSEDFQRNSSFADTNRVQSNEDQHHHDTMDRDSMSESPISTISNPSLARSDSDKLSIRSTSLKDDTRGFSGAMVDAINEKYAHTNGGDWRSVPSFFTEKAPTFGFKNGQPCCCSRKEGASSQIVASSYHQSNLFKKHTVESLNFQPPMLSVSNCPASPAPPMASPTIKIPANSECDSVGSPSKPVLRLMGKNLTVADDVSSSPQFKPPPQVTHSPNVQNEYKFSSLGYHPQHPIIFSHNPNGFKSNNLWSDHQFGTMFQSTTYMDRYSHGSPMIPQANHVQNRFDGQMAKDQRNMSLNRVKEVILIDDSPDDENNDDMRTRRNWASFSSSSIAGHNHMPSGYPSQSSLPFNNGSFQTCIPFREAADNGTKWNCTHAAGSSRSTSHLRSSCYPPSFS